MLRHWSQFVPNMSTRHPRTLNSISPAHESEFRSCVSESRGGRPGFPVLMSLMVSVDVKQHSTMHTHWSQFVPNMSTRHPRTLNSTSSSSDRAMKTNFLRFFVSEKRGLILFLFFFFCNICGADFRGTAPAPLFLASLNSGPTFKTDSTLRPQPPSLTK